MLEDFIAQAGQILRNMSLVEWVVAIGLALTLGVAVVQQLAKTALIVVALIAIGFVVMNARVEHWSF